MTGLCYFAEAGSYGKQVCRGADRDGRPATFSQGSQEIENGLLIAPAELIEIANDRSGLRLPGTDGWLGLGSGARVVRYGLHQVRGAAVVQEEDSLSEAPERGGTELVSRGKTL